MKNLALAKLQAHAVLLTGPDQDYKLAIVLEHSQWLLCSNPSNSACGVCKSCCLVKAGTHPDLYIITPAADSNSILVDQIRELNNFIIGQPQFGKLKIVILYPAESLNNQAANALLKNLEEPGDNTKLFLLAAHQDLLLKTITSRCQILNLGSSNKQIYDNTEILTQMRTDLSVLLIKKNLTSVQLVEKWVKQWPNQVLYCFELLLAELITAKYTQEPREQGPLIGLISSEQLWSMLDQVRQARNWLNTGQRPNLQLILDSIFLEI